MIRKASSRAITTTLALLAAFACGNAAAQSTWTLDAKAFTYPHADANVEHPAMDGSGWLTLHGNQATDQVSYATSDATLDPSFPIQVHYEFLSHSPRKADARVAGFQLMDANVANTAIHREPQGCGMEGDYLTVAFQWMGRYSDPCGGRFNPYNGNTVVLRGAGQQLLDVQPSPVRLACMNYTAMPHDRVAEYECLSRAEGIAKGFVRTVDAWLTPKTGGGGFLLDLALDGHPLFAARDIAIATPGHLRFGLFSQLDSSGSAHEARNVRVSQEAFLVTEDGRCLDILGGVGQGRALIASPCANTSSQVFRRVGEALGVGGLCVDAAPGAAVELIAYACHGGSNQRWVREADGAMRWAGTGECITVSPGQQSARLELCNGGAEQRLMTLSP